AFLTLADKKGQVFDYDLEALVFMNYLDSDQHHYHLNAFTVQSGTQQAATAEVSLTIEEKIVTDKATGNGPVDAVYQAINKITQLPVTIYKYQLTSVTQGKDALGQVNIIAEYNQRRFHGTGIATDIVEASAKALINALNSVWQARLIEQQKQHRH